MVITQAAHGDLSTRLLALIAEYAAASDRAGAEAKLKSILERLPISDSGSDVTVSEADAKRMVDEIERRGEVISELQTENEAGAAKLAAVQTELDAANAEIETIKAALAAATKPKDDQ